jgi:hypothetical protein
MLSGSAVRQNPAASRCFAALFSCRPYLDSTTKSFAIAALSPHRCVPNFLVNLVAGLIAYTYQEKKPSLHIPMPQDESSLVLILIVTSNSGLRGLEMAD